MSSGTYHDKEAWHGSSLQMQLAFDSSLFMRKFVLNAAVDTLPHNANLYLWQKKDTDLCPLCSVDTRNLIHVLNACTVAKKIQ